jgi:GNAT superfamily N-acetyltransferase
MDDVENSYASDRKRTISVKPRTVGVRLFKEKDARKVSHLISRCLNEILSREFTHEQLKFFHRRFTPSGLRKIATQSAVFVAVSGDRILGTASLEGDRVRAVFVNPSFHRQGIGRLLMKHVEDEARRRNLTACTLHSKSPGHRVL